MAEEQTRRSHDIFWSVMIGYTIMACISISFYLSYVGVRPKMDNDEAACLLAISGALVLLIVWSFLILMLPQAKTKQKLLYLLGFIALCPTIIRGCSTHWMIIALGADVSAYIWGWLIDLFPGVLALVAVALQRKRREM